MKIKQSRPHKPSLTSVIKVPFGPPRLLLISQVINSCLIAACQAHANDRRHHDFGSCTKSHLSSGPTQLKAMCMIMTFYCVCVFVSVLVLCFCQAHHCGAFMQKNASIITTVHLSLAQSHFFASLRTLCVCACVRACVRERERERELELELELENFIFQGL